MKNILIIAVVFLIGISNLSAAEHKEKFKVYGNCGMCKKTIEKAVKELKGVSDVQWNKKSKMIEVSYDDASTTIQTIKKAIADAGYDMDDIRANDETYNSLHKCCQYERPAKK